MEDHAPSGSATHDPAARRLSVPRGILSAAMLWLAAAMTSVTCFEGELTPSSMEQLILDEQTPRESKPEPKREVDSSGWVAISLA